MNSNRRSACSASSRCFSASRLVSGYSILIPNSGPYCSTNNSTAFLFPSELSGLFASQLIPNFLPCFFITDLANSVILSSALLVARIRLFEKLAMLSLNFANAPGLSGTSSS